ncbi:hypothetical protein HG531_011574 [Fusarium graminearum]|nr:hypothetical protein HG531_011574 [Fusarium graminearum]
MRQRLYDNVEVVVLLDIVHSNKSRDVLFRIKRLTRASRAIHLDNLLLGVARIRDIFDILERAALHLVTFREDVDALGLEVDVDVVVLVERVKVGVRLGTATLEVLATDQTCVDIDVGEGYGAELLEVKVEHIAIDGVEVEVIISFCRR